MADETTREPLTEAQIKKMLIAAANACGGPRELPSDLMGKITTVQAWQLAYAALTLAPEVERLRAALEDARGDIAFLERTRTTASERAAAAMEIVRVVAVATVTHARRDEYARKSCFHFPGLETAAQLRDQARALLAPTEGATEGDQP